MKMTLIKSKYEGLSVREKVLILLTSLCLFGALFYLLLLEPLLLEQRNQVTRMQQYETTEQAVQQQIGALEELLALDSVAAIGREIDALTALSDELTLSLHGKGISVISPQQTTDFLSRAFDEAKQGEITVAAFQLISVPVPIDQTDAEDEPAASDLVEQRVSLNLSGTVSGLTAYLKTLESFPEGIIWDSLVYQQVTAQDVDISVEFHLFSVQD